MSAATWGIVATMDEPPALVANWAAYHLVQGAAELHIFLDRDNEATRGLLDQLPNTYVTVGDGAFYRRVFDTKRPINHQFRQSRNATYAYQNTGVDYLLHMDADEYLIQHSSLIDELSTRRRNVYFSIPNIERAYLSDPTHIFDGVFRRSHRFDETLEEGRFDADGLTRWGFAGHAEGKAITPTGRDYALGIHRPRLPGPGKRRFPPIRRVNSSVIAHFEGFTPLDWVQKRLRKAVFLERSDGQPVADNMRAQIDRLIAVGQDRDGVFALHDQLKRVEPDQAEVIDLDVEFDAALRRAFPNENLDLSVQGFDRWLKREKAEFFRAFEFLL